MNSSQPLPTPLPASAWGPDTARICAREDEALARQDPRDGDVLYRQALTAALRYRD